MFPAPQAWERHSTEVNRANHSTVRAIPVDEDMSKPGRGRDGCVLNPVRRKRVPGPVGIGPGRRLARENGAYSSVG